MGSSVCMKTARWLKDTVRGILLPRKPRKNLICSRIFGRGVGGDRDGGRADCVSCTGPRGREFEFDCG